MKRFSIILLAFALLFSSCKADINPEKNAVSVESVEQTEIDEEYNQDYVEDFEYAFDILKTYYPFFDVNEIITGEDVLAYHDEFLSWIKECKTDDDFLYTMDGILENFNNDHTNMIHYDEANLFYNLYREIPEHHMSWISNLYEKEYVKKRYNIKKESLDQPIEEEESHAEVGDYVDGKIAYIRIYSMASDREKDEKMIYDYLKTIKNHRALIIDIQGNPGGDSTYWSDFLLPKIIKNEHQRMIYSFMKSGEIMEQYYNSSDYELLTDEIIDGLDFPQRTKDIVKKFDKYVAYEEIVSPDEDSIGFDGNIYLLVDRGVYSSAEALVSFVKSTKIATLVGTKTGGDGIGTDPFQIDLPNTGFVMRFPKELGTTEDGIINELDKTDPDVFVEADEEDLNEKSKEMVLKLEGIK